LSLSEKLYEYRGPVVISDVNISAYKNKNVSFTNEQWERGWGVPTKNTAYDSISIGNKKDAIEQFKSLNKILKVN
jgi:hypothetical protein